ncbi:MAG: response regulator [Anaerolineae bacterium]|nr:response regulator [Anaerolineae bacterium]
MATRVLIIHRQLVFAVTIKQALEQTGAFDVHPFTKADAALDYLREHPQDVAVVDFNLPGRSGAKVVQQLRALQPDLAVIATPKQPEAEAGNLNLQGMINAPFTARDLVPLLQNAADQQAQIHLPQSVEDSRASIDPATTHSLGQEKRIRRQQYGTTSLFGEEQPPEIQDMPPGTNILESEPTSETPIPVFSEDTPVPPRFESPQQTRLLDDPLSTEAGIPTAEQPSSPPSMATRLLDDVSPPASGTDRLKTRQLDAEEPPPPEDLQTRDLGLKRTPAASRPAPPTSDTVDLSSTRRLPKESRDLPQTPAQFTPLDQVLQSFGFDPPPEEMDTPSVPTKNSDAMRQFLATGGGTEAADTFDDVLGAIEEHPTSRPPKDQRGVDFEGLVQSMRSEDPHRPLPDRQQQLMDFILTTGMDSVLQEIEKTKTGPLKVPPKERVTPPPPPTVPEAPPPPEPSAFDQLAQEEPPLPSLEENGTVSDLLIGIADSNFRDVLSILQDEDRGDTPPRPKPAVSAEPASAEFDSDFLNTLKPPDVKEKPHSTTRFETPPPQTPSYATFDFDFDYNDESGEATVAQVVLQTTLDQATAAEGFSLDQLLTDIEDRLNTHQLRIRPLPSWEMDTTAFLAVVNKAEAEVREPGFLPDDFSTGEFIPPDLPEFESPEVDSGRTTMAGRSSGDTVETYPTDAETTLEPGYFEEEVLPAEPATMSVLADELWDVVEPEAYPEAAEFQDEMEQAAPPVESEISFDFGEAEPENHVFMGLDEVTVEVEETPVEPVEAAAEVEEELSAASMDEWALPGEIPAEARPAPMAEVDEETRLAQIALNLTQVSLELSAEATILTRENEIIALAGHLSNEDVLELRGTIQNDWSADAQGARLRFVTLPSSGKEYMLYSTLTAGGLVLSMIFTGTTPLRLIRQQGQRLTQALQSVPEPAPQPTAAAAPTTAIVEDTLAREAYAFVWLLRDPKLRLNRSIARSITAGLTIQLQEFDWRILNIQANENYIYLLAEVPGEEPAHRIVRDLKQRSADIAYAQDQSFTPQMLWDDSYLVLTPGRELTLEEIHEFINFQQLM